MWPFYLYGRLIAVLEQGARAHGEVPWLEQYYPRGFFPLAGLREPLERHRHSVLNHLVREQRAKRYMARLDSLASALSNSEEEITFDTWASHYLSYDESRRPEVPDRSTPRDATLYAQGYLDERIDLQPNRPSPAAGRKPLAVLLGLPPGTPPHLQHRRQLPQPAPRDPAGHSRPQGLDQRHPGPSWPTKETRANSTRLLLDIPPSRPLQCKTITAAKEKQEHPSVRTFNKIFRPAQSAPTGRNNRCGLYAAFNCLEPNRRRRRLTGLTPTSSGPFSLGT